MFLAWLSFISVTSTKWRSRRKKAQGTRAPIILIHHFISFFFGYKIEDGKFSTSEASEEEIKLRVFLPPFVSEL